MRRPELSYANVMSSIAVFLALGGTSYAVAKNSIGERHLKQGAVTSPKIKDGSVTTADLAPGAALSGPRGPRGEQGPAGVAGPRGASEIPKAWVARRWEGRQLPGAATVITALGLPAGNYSVHAMTHLYAPTPEVTAECGITIAGATHSATATQMGSNAAATVISNIAMSDVIELKSPATVAFQCGQRGGHTFPLTAHASTLQALPVGAVEVQ